MSSYGVPTQVWEAGFQGLYSEDAATEPVTSKVGMPADRRETRKERLQKERMEQRFQRDVLSRAEMFKSALSKFDIDGDGKLSYVEFSKGLQELGVKLPEPELRAIWSQEANEKPWQAMEDHVAAHSERLPHKSDQYHGNDKARVGARSIRIPVSHNKYRPPRTDVEEKSRAAVQRKMMRQFAHRGNEVDRFFASISKRKRRNGNGNPDLLSFEEYHECMQDLGALLSEEDLGHLWDSCQQHGTSDGKSNGENGHYVALEQLAGALGTQRPDPPLVADPAVEKSAQLRRTASLAREKVLHQLRGKRQQISNSFLISDERGTGKLGLAEFKSCLRSAGLILGDQDCRAVLESCDQNADPDSIEYDKFLSFVTQTGATQARYGLQESRTASCESEIVPSHEPSQLLNTVRDLASPRAEPAPPHATEVSNAAEEQSVEASLQDKLPALKRMVGQQQGRGGTDLPVSIWEFRRGLGELGIAVEGGELRRLYETARVDMQGRIDCDLLTQAPAAGNAGGYSGTAPLFGAAESPEQAGRRAHPFTPKTPRDSADASRLVDKIAASRIGNPHKLSAMFRKYDEFPRHHSCSAEEFVQVLIDGAVDIPRAEAASLAERLLRPNGQIDYREFVGVVGAARKQQDGLRLEVSVNTSLDDKGTKSHAPSEGSGQPSPPKSKLAFGAPAQAVVDRGSWIEEVVSNSMRESHRFERQRIKTLCGPPSTGTRILHMRAGPGPPQTSACQ